MEKIKVVITHPSQLFERWINYYYMDDLAEAFDLEYWDCSQVVTPSYKVHSKIERSYVRSISTLEEFRELLSKLPSDTILITEVYLCAENYEFHKIQSTYFPSKLHFNFYGNNISGIDLEENSATKIPVSRKNILKSLLYKSVFLKSIIKWIFHHADCNFKKRQLDEKCQRLYKGGWGITCKNDTGKRINHPDFENFLKIKDTERLIQHDYVVFIDTYYPYHPESFFFGNAPENIDEIAQSYHKTMNDYFDRIEREMGIPVVIAAHPYANYKERNPFNGREVYYYQTDKLIKDCVAVCMHGSNAFSYVALFDKPVQLCINSAIRGTFLGNMAELSAQKFHMPLFETDCSASQTIRFEKMINSLRIKYINKYLGDNATPKSNKQLIINHIKEYYQVVNGN